MASDVGARAPAARGVNSARGWSRIGRAFAVEAIAVLGGVALLFFAVVGPGLSNGDWFEDWGFVAALLAIPLVATIALVVASIRLRVALVGPVCAVLLGSWGLLEGPWRDRPGLWWGVGLVVAPVLASLLTHPRSGRVDGPVDLQAGAADLDDPRVDHR